MEHNPYQTPEANVEIIANTEIGSAEEIRKEYINHEASLRSVGLLYYLGGTVTVIMGFATVVGGIADQQFGVALGLGILVFALGGLQLWVGRGFRQLRSKIKILATLFSVLGLFSIPVGTLINGYILYLIYSAKGELVFSEKYQNIIEATPHIKYKTSIIVWLFVGLIVLVIGAALVMPAMSV
jgi:hypothetical protein